MGYRRIGAIITVALPCDPAIYGGDKTRIL
ncbi:hypothetical protein EYZ11_002238 [Aspergillus tanneri]|uniref:Uncharacterized protein n=1 Tax=Aspergillus tanneri TaxID=1220188 RepID=A0A4S3JRS2_9EURO|nr:hypothetical protein EYZ11_002238 [Aspergillus tanneri]